jgi:hypothetical protein
MKMSFIRYKASSRDILWLTWFAKQAYELLMSVWSIFTFEVSNQKAKFVPREH